MTDTRICTTCNKRMDANDSRRDQMVAAALTGLLAASGENAGTTESQREYIAHIAVAQADAALKEIDEQMPPHECSSSKTYYAPES